MDPALLQEYRVPSPEFKPKGKVSEERSLIPREMPKLELQLHWDPVHE